MDKQDLMNAVQSLQEQAQGLAAKAEALAAKVTALDPTGVASAAEAATHTPFLYLFTAFVLACVVGYYVVWSVTPALHSPLMGVTNAISSVIIVGALIAAGPTDMSLSKVFGFIAVVLASVNIFGGFVVTNRMLSMFKKKQR
ncbi:MAG: NAD(P) transhydrogenase subunit alpha [Alphaproteobacteria bacterium]|nr:NAD(P) transhydrogenase subunit alpha [Alphaproteobacteria bacterium]